MEVVLKKTKITKSILQQSIYGHESLYIGNPNYDFLGWCRIKDDCIKAINGIVYPFKY